MKLRIGLSTCPNDTFAFHGLLSGAVRIEGVEPEFVLADVEELNQRMLAGELDIAKVSAHLALCAADRLVVLPVGAALGFGVGPLLLASRERAVRARPRVLLPGAYTTAALLFALFHGTEGDVEHVRFDEIPRELAAGTADLGVCIHEARFTWPSWGVDLVEDLGLRYERETGAALPLGLIAARRDVPRAAALAFAEGLRRSIAYARTDADGAFATMRAHAQELDGEAIRKHVELYVTDATVDLGEEGRRALAALAALARARGLVPPGADLEVLGP